MFDVLTRKKGNKQGQEGRQGRVAINERELDEALARVKFFPGSQEEYERLVGYEVRIIDTKMRDMGVTLIRSDHCEGGYKFPGIIPLKKRLVEQGVEAIIRTRQPRLPLLLF